MATKRCLNTLSRHRSYLFSSNSLLENSKPKSLLPQALTLDTDHHFQLEIPNKFHPHFGSLCYMQSKSNWVLKSHRNFSSERRNHGKQSDDDDEVEEHEDEDDDDEDEDEDEDEGELSEDEEGEEVGRNGSGSNGVVNRTYSLEEKRKEAADIGYEVIGPLDPTERPFKPWEPVFAVVQIGSHQFKVSNGDAIYTERLKFCEVNDKLSLSKVLMVGSKNQTIIGRPILPEATVYAVVEEHALDAKVIIFKKKRRKNYRRTKGHRQELTRLRITKIEGLENPEKEAVAA